MLEKRGIGFGAALAIESEIHKLLGLSVQSKCFVYAYLHSHSFAGNWRDNPPTTGEELLEFMLTNPKLQGYFKQDPTKPVKVIQNMIFKAKPLSSILVSRKQI